MLRMTMLAISFACLPMACTFAQQELDPSHQLRVYGNRMVGGTWQQTKEGIVVSKHTYRWALGNQYMLCFRWEKNAANSVELVGVDPSNKLQTRWSYSDDGQVDVSAIGVARIDANTDRLTFPDGDPKTKGELDVKWSDDGDRLEINGLPGAMINGLPLNKDAWIRTQEADDLKWVAATEGGKITKRWPITQRFIGKKATHGTMPDGLSFVGAAEGKWMLGGHFQIYTGTVALSDNTTWSHILVTGIDPNTDALAGWEFTTLGAKNAITYDDSGTSIKGLSIRSNGEKYTFAGSFEFDGKELHYKAALGPEGGEQEPYAWNFRVFE